MIHLVNFWLKASLFFKIIFLLKEHMRFDSFWVNFFDNDTVSPLKSRYTSLKHFQMFLVSHKRIVRFATQMKIFLIRLQSLWNDKFFYVTMWHKKYTHCMHVHYSKCNKTKTNYLNVYLDAYDVTESASKQHYLSSNATIENAYEVRSSKIKVSNEKLWFC